MTKEEKIDALLKDSVNLLRRPPHKASIDPNVIKAIGKKGAEAYLTNMYGAPVRIKDIEKWGVSYNRRNSHKFGYLYIAEVTYANDEM